MHEHKASCNVCAAGQKGSDASAREATKKLVAASKQLRALQAVLGKLGVTTVAEETCNDENAMPTPRASIAASAVKPTVPKLALGALHAAPANVSQPSDRVTVGRNTIVRQVLSELSSSSSVQAKQQAGPVSARTRPQPKTTTAPLRSARKVHQ